MILVQSIGECRCCGFIDDAHDFEACDRSGILGRLALCVVEVGGNRNDGLIDLATKMRFSIRFQLLENHG